jgi:hypothetical protein
MFPKHDAVPEALQALQAMPLERQHQYIVKLSTQLVLSVSEYSLCTHEVSI